MSDDTDVHENAETVRRIYRMDEYQPIESYHYIRDIILQEAGENGTVAAVWVGRGMPAEVEFLPAWGSRVFPQTTPITVRADTMTDAVYALCAKLRLMRVAAGAR